MRENGVYAVCCERENNGVVEIKDEVQSGVR